MSAAQANSKSQISDVDPNSEVESETEALVNFDMASRSSIQRRLSFSIDPSSDNNYPKRLKSDAAKDIPPQREEVPVSTKKGEEAEEVKKTWNLRSRKACGGGASEVKNQEFGGGMELRSNRQRRIPAESPGISGGVEVTKGNHRLWISLSREEIEEDLFIISGNRPSRRPRKRTKTLQKRLNVIFPGSCLVGKNADDCFRVYNSQAKR